MSAHRNAVRLAGGLALAVALGASAPARAELLGFELHLNGGVGSLSFGRLGTFTTAKPPIGIDVGVSTGLVPLLRLEFFADGMSSFNQDIFLSLGARLLYALSDHFDLGISGNAGYSFVFTSKVGGLGWMVGPHLQFHFFILNLFYQPTFTKGVFDGPTAFYPLYGGVGVQF